MSGEVKIIGSRVVATDAINAFHTLMFHGKVRREGVGTGGPSAHRYGEALDNPILYTCNGYRTPDFAMPVVSLIVSRDVYNALKDLPGIMFADVRVEKVVYLPYSAGDFSFFERADFRKDPVKAGFETVFERWPDRPELHSKVEPRYEIVMPRGRLLAASYPSCQEMILPSPTGEDEPEPELISLKMIEEYSLVQFMAGTVVTLETFRRIEPFLNKDYYAVADFRIA